MTGAETKNGISVDVTVSGCLKSMYRLPNGKLRDFKDKDNNSYSVWLEDKKPRSFKINVLNVEYYQKQTYPIVEVEFRRKNVSKLYEWWWGDFDSSKVWDVKIKKKGEKTVTMVRIGEQTMHIDNDVSEIENALNSICAGLRG